MVDDRGHEVWEFEGQHFTQVGMNAVAGREQSLKNLEPTRFDDMRRGCWDIHERIRDMDLNGVWAVGELPVDDHRVLRAGVRPGLRPASSGWATTRAWNDWLHDEWWQPYPDRIVPLGITFLSDPEKGAAEIRRNAERGFVAVTLPERPHRIGLPSLFTGYWDPIIEACAETDTVIALHVGSSGGYESPEGAPSLQLGATMFGQLSLAACAEWLWSGYPVRYPDLKIAMSEGGIGWVAMLLDRLDNIVDRSGYGAGLGRAPGRRAEAQLLVLHPRRPVDDRHPPPHRRREHHVRDRLPARRRHLARHPGRGRARSTATSPPTSCAMILSENAARLFRHPLPDVVLPRSGARGDGCRLSGAAPAPRAEPPSARTSAPLTYEAASEARKATSLGDLARAEPTRPRGRCAVRAASVPGSPARGEHRRVDHARVDRVDPDAEGAELDGGRPRDAPQRPLADDP